MTNFLIDLLWKMGITRGHDKILHALAGLIVGAISMVLVGVYAIPTVLAVAAGKELYDKYIKKTYFDFFDMFATILGGWFGIALAGMLI